jgi:glycosyltransferase involved in cell wall biosynthesis
MVRAVAPYARATVIAPVPYVPPFTRQEVFSRYRSIPRLVKEAVGDVHHPRVLTGPGLWLHAFDARLMSAAVSRLVQDIHRTDPVDLIHAHFIYPEGVVAAVLGRHLGVPVMTTEHAHWIPWLSTHPALRKQVAAAIPHIRLLTGVSPSVCDGIRAIGSGDARVEWLPNVLDDRVFVAPMPNEQVNPHQLLFVGVVRRVKGLDVLVRALSTLVGRHPALRLRVIGEPYQRAYRRDEEVVRELVASLGLLGRVEFSGQATPAEVAKVMRESALLVVPSRRESFSSVAVEALSSGTPVVATRCGGPEHIVMDEMGRLVPPEDPDALASAIDEMLAARPSIDRMKLHRYATEKFGFEASSRRISRLYAEVVGAPS